MNSATFLIFEDQKKIKLIFFSFQIAGMQSDTSYYHKGTKFLKSE